jgi:hypothetical protein
VVKNKYNGVKYSNEYAAKFHTTLNRMVESQMKSGNCNSKFLVYGVGKRRKIDPNKLVRCRTKAATTKALKKDTRLFKKEVFWYGK